MSKAFSRTFAVIDVLLLISALGVLIYDIVVLLKFTEEIVGTLAGFVVFSITIQSLTLIAILVGLRAFFIKAQMWIITSNALLCAAMCFTIIGATFFTVLAGKTSANDDGFRRIVADIELNFNIQVFNDCCEPLVLQEFQGFSLGDIVSDDLCDLLEDNEADSFVGDEDTSCGDDGAGVLEFEAFEDDFKGFTGKFYAAVQGILWTQATLMLLSFLLNCSQISCSAPEPETKEEDENPEVDMSGLANFPNVPAMPMKSREPSMAPPASPGGSAKAMPPPLPPNKPMSPPPLIPHAVRNKVGNFVGGLSARFGRTSNREGDGTEGPPGGFFGALSRRIPRPPQMPTFGGSSKKTIVFNPPSPAAAPAPPSAPGMPVSPTPPTPVSPMGSYVSERDKADLWKSL